MILDFNTDKTINSALFLITSLSPKAKEGIELELYRASADSDGSTDQFILEDAFGNLINDLQNIGIIVSFDYDNITDDLNKVFAFLHFASYLFPNSLYPLLKTQSDITTCIEHILTGSLGDEESLIQTYMSQLGGLDGQTALVPELTDTLDQLYPLISQTEIFSDYMKNLLDLVMQERLTVDADTHHHQDFRDFARTLITRLSDAVNTFADQPFYNRLCVIQNWIIKDLTSPSNFIAYHYLFNTDVTTLPDDLVAGYKKKWYEYFVSHMWCLDYYSVRKLVPGEGEVIMMYGFQYAYHHDVESYTKQVQTLKALYPSPAVEGVIATLYQDHKS